jgi:hypothetical protein
MNLITLEVRDGEGNILDRIQGSYIVNPLGRSLEYRFTSKDHLDIIVYKDGDKWDYPGSPNKYADAFKAALWKNGA